MAAVALVGTPPYTGANANSAGTTSLTFAFDPTGADCLVLNYGGWDGGSSAVPTAVTHNGDAFTLVVQQPASPMGGDDCSAMWRRLAPDQTSANVVVTLDAAGISECGAHPVPLVNVNQTTPTGTVARTANDDSPTSTDVTASSTDELVLITWYGNYDTSPANSPTQGAGQTITGLQTIVGADSGSANGGSSKAGINGTVNLTLTAAGGNFDICGAPFKAAAASSCTPMFTLMGVGRCMAPFVGLEWLRHRKNRIRSVN